MMKLKQGIPLLVVVVECVYTHTHIHYYIFKGLSMIGILNLDAQNTLKFICLYSLNNRIRYVKLVI